MPLSHCFSTLFFMGIFFMGRGINGPPKKEKGIEDSKKPLPFSGEG
jgi:hypothetical protein